MPALADRVTSQVDMGGYIPVDKPATPPMGGLPEVIGEPGLNAYLRCPLPPVWSTESDSLRQFYRNSAIPQTRLFNPTPPTNGGGSTTTINNVSSGSSSGGGSGTSTIAITQASLKTSSIGPNSTFVGTLTLSKAFQLLTLGASSPCRVRLYGTLAAQSADSYRGLDVPPPAGTIQNIICDVVMDTSPLHWTFQDRVGANGDSPVTSTIYISVTNLEAISDTFTLSFSYVPIVS